MITIQENIHYNVCIDYLNRQMKSSTSNRNNRRKNDGEEPSTSKEKKFSDDRNPDGYEDEDLHIFVWNYLKKNSN